MKGEKMTNLIKSFTYGEDIEEKTAVKFSEEGVVVKATSNSDKVCGVTLFTGREGVRGDILMLGLGVVATSGAVNAGDFLVAGENGKLEALDLENAEENIVIVARVLETASSSAHLSAIVNPQLITVNTDVQN
jgi:hypothetical protein